MVLEHLEVLHVVAEPVEVGPDANTGRIGDEPERRALLAALESGRTRSSVYASMIRSVYVNVVACSTRISIFGSSLLLLLLGIGAGKHDLGREVRAAELAADHVEARDDLAEHASSEGGSS